MTPKELFRQNNFKSIMKFVHFCVVNEEDEVAHAIQATLSQFLGQLKIELNARENEEQMLSNVNIIDAQIEALRRCVIDLSTAKSMIETGVTAQ